jgi:hypothetical protein
MRHRPDIAPVIDWDYYLFVQERETGRWQFVRMTTYYSDRPGTPKRHHYETERPSYVYPKPEHVSCFIKQHKIIKAKSEVEAWQILNSK